MHLLFFGLVLCLKTVNGQDNLNSTVLNTHETNLSDWNEYVKIFSKFYTDLNVTNFKRKKIFEENVIKIAKWNKEYEEGQHSYKQGINPLTAKTKEERKRMSHSIKIASNISHADVNEIHLLFKKRLPKNYDWRKKGIISDVRYQGDCSACYAFTVLDVLEAKYAIEGQYVELSAQMLVDCTYDFNDGCEGGYLSRTYEYIKDIGGVATEDEYPFTAQVGMCREHEVRKPYKIKRMMYLPAGDERMLQKALYHTGPISVALDSSLDAFQNYEGGIFDEEYCKTVGLEHSGALVGYGTENGIDFWIIKNSWSEYWGERGYIRLRRNYGNRCGVASNAMYPVI